MSYGLIKNITTPGLNVWNKARALWSSPMSPTTKKVAIIGSALIGGLALAFYFYKQIPSYSSTSEPSFPFDSEGTPSSRSPLVPNSPSPSLNRGREDETYSYIPSLPRTPSPTLILPGSVKTDSLTSSITAHKPQASPLLPSHTFVHLREDTKGSTIFN